MVTIITLGYIKSFVFNYGSYTWDITVNHFLMKLEDYRIREADLNSALCQGVAAPLTGTTTSNRRNIEFDYFLTSYLDPPGVLLTEHRLKFSLIRASDNVVLAVRWFDAHTGDLPADPYHFQLIFYTPVTEFRLKFEVIPNELSSNAGTVGTARIDNIIVGDYGEDFDSVDLGQLPTGWTISGDGETAVTDLAVTPGFDDRYFELVTPPNAHVNDEENPNNESCLTGYYYRYSRSHPGWYVIHLRS